MSVRDLIPRNRGGSQVSGYRGEQSPFLELHREMNRLFDDMFRGFDSRLPATSGTSNRMPAGNWPGVEVSENDKELRVTAEIPGVDEPDLEVMLEDDVLILRGEKRSETEDKDRQFSERYYGSFERRIPLGTEIEEDKVGASFKNGVLTVTLPKSAKAQQRTRRIAINGQPTTH